MTLLSGRVFLLLVTTAYLVTKVAFPRRGPYGRLDHDAALLRFHWQLQRVKMVDDLWGSVFCRFKGEYPISFFSKRMIAEEAVLLASGHLVDTNFGYPASWSGDQFFARLRDTHMKAGFFVVKALDTNAHIVRVICKPVDIEPFRHRILE